MSVTQQQVVVRDHKEFDCWEQQQQWESQQHKAIQIWLESNSIQHLMATIELTLNPHELNVDWLAEFEFPRRGIL